MVHIWVCETLQKKICFSKVHGYDASLSNAHDLTKIG